MDVGCRFSCRLTVVLGGERQLKVTRVDFYLVCASGASVEVIHRCVIKPRLIGKPYLEIIDTCSVFTTKLYRRIFVCIILYNNIIIWLQDKSAPIISAPIKYYMGCAETFKATYFRLFVLKQCIALKN